MDSETKKTPEAAVPATEARETREAERPREVQPAAVDKELSVSPQPLVLVRSAVPEAPAAPSDPGIAAMERILEEDLREIYFSMSNPARDKFRALGEELARRLHGLASSGSARPNAVHRLVDRWLTLIPDLNAFWLFQAGKIKTDRLIKEMGGDR